MSTTPPKISSDRSQMATTSSSIVSPPPEEPVSPKIVQIENFTFQMFFTLKQMKSFLLQKIFPKPRTAKPKKSSIPSISSQSKAKSNALKRANRRSMAVLTNFLYTLYLNPSSSDELKFKLKSSCNLIPELLSKNYYMICRDILQEIDNLKRQSEHLSTELKLENARHKELLEQVKDLNSRVSNSIDLPLYSVSDAILNKSDVTQPETRMLNICYFLRKLLYKEMQSIPTTLRSKATLKNIFFLESASK